MVYCLRQLLVNDSFLCVAGASVIGSSTCIDAKGPPETRRVVWNSRARWKFCSVETSTCAG